MKAVRCQHHEIHVVDVPAPAGDGVRVRIASAGICGSDLHLVSSAFPLAATLGHEMAGFLPDGRAVAIEPLAPCGHCDSCARGDYNLCRRGPAMVMGMELDGGMAEEILVPARAIVPLASGVIARDACLIEPLAVALHGLRLAGFRPDQKVLIVGGGSIGLCALAAATQAGAATTLLARHDGQKAAAERLGARQLAEGEYDLVIDAAGSASALQSCLYHARPGATLLLLATYWDGLQLDGFTLAMKEIRVISASMYGHGGSSRDIDNAAALLALRPAIAAAIITHRFPLDAAREAFATAADRAAGAIKVVLEP